MSVHKFVITGGPCGGKTTAIQWIQAHFKKKGYYIIVVSETATDLINSGVAPWTCISSVAYQRCQMHMQLEKEKIYDMAAQVIPAEKIILIYDRGAMDNAAYVSPEEFDVILEEVQCTREKLRERYDAVFHLVTAAKGAEQYYTTANNAARTETVEEAAVLDDKFIEAWGEHPHYVYIDNAGSFDDKMRKLIAGMEALLDKE